MKKAVLILIAALTLTSLATTGVATADDRVAIERYRLGSSECGRPSLVGSCVLLDVHRGEKLARIVLHEESATASLQWPVMAQVRLVGAADPWRSICNEGEIPILPGTTALVIDVQHGERNGICATTEYSPALDGSITVAFSR